MDFVVLNFALFQIHNLDPSIKKEIGFYLRFVKKFPFDVFSAQFFLDIRFFCRLGFDVLFGRGRPDMNGVGFLVWTLNSRLCCLASFQKLVSLGLLFFRFLEFAG
jgi:hypothetical protein